MVELLVVVVIMGLLLAIGIPAYRSVGKTSRIKACMVNQRELVNQANDYYVDNNFNPDEASPYIYTIIPNKDNSIGRAHYEPDANQNSLLTDVVHGGRVLCCPAGGTITITVKHGAVYPVITAVCTGGTDGDCHKPEEK